MNGIGRLLFAEGVHQEACTGDYKGNTQNLTHVQKHVSFEGNLIIFDKLNEETGAEADHQEDADEGAAIYLFQFVPIHPQEHEAQQEISAGLVELRRMGGNGFPVAQEDETPGKAGGTAVNFRVEEVAQADEAGGEGHRDHQMVQHCSWWEDHAQGP